MFPFTDDSNQIVRTGALLDFSTGHNEKNPRYRDALGALYFDVDDKLCCARRQRQQPAQRRLQVAAALAVLGAAMLVRGVLAR